MTRIVTIGRNGLTQVLSPGQHYLRPLAGYFDPIQGPYCPDQDCLYSVFGLTPMPRMTNIICSGCDGSGRYCDQLSKDACDRQRGYRRRHGDCWVYFTPDGREMPIKTVGGPCTLCHGHDTLSVP